MEICISFKYFQISLKPDHQPVTWSPPSSLATTSHKLTFYFFLPRRVRTEKKFEQKKNRDTFPNQIFRMFRWRHDKCAPKIFSPVSHGKSGGCLIASGKASNKINFLSFRSFVANKSYSSKNFGATSKSRRRSSSFSIKCKSKASFKWVLVACRCVRSFSSHSTWSHFFWNFFSFWPALFAGKKHSKEKTLPASRRHWIALGDSAANLLARLWAGQSVIHLQLSFSLCSVLVLFWFLSSTLFPLLSTRIQFIVCGKWRHIPGTATAAHRCWTEKFGGAAEARTRSRRGGCCSPKKQRTARMQCQR